MSFQSLFSATKTSINGLKLITSGSVRTTRFTRSFADKPGFLNADTLTPPSEVIEDIVDMEETPTGSVVATVFGATGQIGRFTVNYLAKTGAQVIVPYRGEERYHSHLRLNGEVGQIVPVRWTTTDKEAIRIAVEQSNVVINLTGKNHETKNFTFQQANVEPAINIAEACREAKVPRFINVSAVGVDRDNQSKFIKARSEAEKAVQEIFPEVTTVRITTPFGRVDRFLHRFGWMANRLPFFLLMANPERKIQPVYSQDVAQALAIMSFDPRTKGKIFELGGPDVMTWHQFAEYILKQCKFDDIKPILKMSPNSYLSKAIATLMSKSRSKIWTPDDLVYYDRDIVADPEALSFKDLGIKPKSLQESAFIFQLYKSKLRA